MVFYYHRPLSAMYGDNYRRYLNDVERKYRSTLSRTHLRSDRGDLGLYTFAGSHLHGGTPAAEKIYTTKSKGSQNLYAPVGDLGYEKSYYYDSLRATTPELRRNYYVRYSPFLDYLDYTYPSRRYYDTEYSYTYPYRRYYDTEYSYTYPYRRYYDTEYSYKTSPTKISTSDLDSDLKKTTTKTTTTETWMPLTTYIYNTPYHTYYYKATPFSSYTYRTADDLYNYDYLDDFRRYSKITTTSKNIDALDLSYTSSMEKCAKIQSQIDEVSRMVSEAESKMKSEISTSRSYVQADLASLASAVDDTARYNDELYKAIRKQAKQIANLSSQYENINRNIADVADTLEKSRTRCQTLQSDLHSVQSSIEMASKRVIVV